MCIGVKLIFLTLLTWRMTLIDIKTVTLTGKGQVSIPKNLRNAASLAENQKIAILTYDDHLELRPMKQINDKLFTALASEKALAKDWLSKEDEKAWKGLQKAKSSSSRSRI
jgi:AbrB family looped-hinge helix DNA binding protein